jgi:hypothetical protein
MTHKPEWQTDLEVLAPELNLATDTDQWHTLVAHVDYQRRQAQQALALDQVKLQIKPGITTKDILVLRTGDNPPEALRPVAQQLYNALAARGMETLVVITPMGLDNLRPRDARALLEEISAELPDDPDPDPDDAPQLEQPPTNSATDADRRQGELFPPECAHCNDEGYTPLGDPCDCPDPDHGEP